MAYRLLYSAIPTFCYIKKCNNGRLYQTNTIRLVLLESNTIRLVPLLVQFIKTLYARSSKRLANEAFQWKPSIFRRFHSSQSSSNNRKSGVKGGLQTALQNDL